jgi:hypothetical protein
MSLIDDALRRAQSAQSEPDRKEGMAASPMPLPDAGRARRRRLILSLAGTAIAGGIIALLFALISRGPGAEPREEASAELPSSVPTSVPARTGRVASSGKPEAQTAPGPPDISVSDVVVPPPPSRAERSAPSAQSAQSAPPDAAPVPVAPGAESQLRVRELPPTVRYDPSAPMAVASGSPAIVRSEEARSRPAAPRARSYVRETVLPSGGRLTLDGIVFSENPAAVINGRVVRPGSFVEGFEVVGIQADRVELRDGATAIVLLLK